MAPPIRKRHPPPRKSALQPLDKEFNSLFCYHKKSCTVKMDKRRNIARITCKVCGKHFETTINHVSEPIDVYNQWIDAFNDANKD